VERLEAAEEAAYTRLDVDDRADLTASEFETAS
jgi:hypothetical protein